MRILVVEDEALLREVVTAELADSGFDVVEAETGEAALTHLQADPPIDLLFTDIRLPGTVDGWQVAERFREVHPDIPVIYATGFSSGHTPVSGSLFFRKPFKISQLIWCVRALTQGRVAMG